MAKQPFKVTSSKPQKTTGGNATTKAAAKRASGSSSSSYVGFSHPNSIFNGASAALATPRPSASPTLTLPNGTPTVTPIAPPTINPFLAPTDEANEQTENGQWDDYISNLLQQQQTNDSDVTLKTGDIDRSLSQGLESNDWNSAARGLGNSSIKDQNKAQMVTQAAATKGNEIDKQTTFHNYVAGQKKQVDTVYKPGISAKYNQLRVDNATKAIDGWNSGHPNSPIGPNGAPNPYYVAPASGGAADAGGGAAPASGSGLAGAGGPAAPGAAPTISAAGSQSQGGTPQTIIKDGKVYHYYPDRPGGQQYVYVRPATH